MDNAAKALVIAGGILIGMLIITLSMYLYTSFQDAYEKSMQIHSSVEINAFNTYFTRYGGSGSTIMGSDAYNIMSRAYEVSKDDDSIVDRMTAVIHDDTISAASNIDLNNFYLYFYFSDKYEQKYEYVYNYNSEGIVNNIDITLLH